MARLRRFDPDKNVLEAARERLRYIRNEFDSYVVSFSGGKDSQVTLHLAKEILPHPINVVFRDEELIPDCIIDYVKSYRDEPWVKMRWPWPMTASTMSWLRIRPPQGARPGRSGSRQWARKASRRTSALCPQ